MLIVIRNMPVTKMSTLLYVNVVAAIIASVAKGSEETGVLSDTGSSTNKQAEYCNGETFQAACLKSEVIIIREARYGRMRLGRCLSDEGQRLLTSLNDPQVLGCFVDVIDILDSNCSGFNSCEIRAADLEYRVVNPCWSALKRYLEVSYECLQVVEPDRTCTVSVTSSAQHLMISHSSSTELSCGSRHQPWKLEAPAGQQINVSLLDFSTKTSDKFSTCIMYGYILDSAAMKNVSICALEAERNKRILVTATNVLQVIINPERNESKALKRRFLLGMQAVGCSDVLAPVDTWMRRMEDEAVVGCYTSRQTWRLRCVNNQWRGVIGNCTREMEVNRDNGGQSRTDTQQTMRNPNQVIVIVTITVVTVALCTVIVCCGIVCTKRYYSMMIYKNRPGTLKTEPDSNGKHLIHGLTKDHAHTPILVHQ